MNVLIFHKLAIYCDETTILTSMKCQCTRPFSVILVVIFQLFIYFIYYFISHKSAKYKQQAKEQRGANKTDNVSDFRHSKNTRGNPKSTIMNSIVNKLSKN
jgi:uncharacterized membrane protein